MRKIFTFLFIFCSLQYIYSQQEDVFQGTIRRASDNTFRVIIKPNRNFSGVISNLTITIQIPTSYLPAPALSVLSTGIHTPTDFNTAPLSYPNSGGTGFNNFTYIVAKESASISINSGQEFMLAEFSISNITLSNNPATSDIRLAHMPNGGAADGNQAFYVESGGTDLTNYTQMFYGNGASGRISAEPKRSRTSSPYSNTGYDTYNYVSIATTALPLNLLSFNAKMVENKAKLNWETAQEVNTEKFEVQKSTGNDSYQTIGEVAARGNAAEKFGYAFEADQPEAMAYYRLKMIDNDGKFEFSKVVGLANENALATKLSVYPNPAIGDKVSVSYESNNTSTGSLVLVSNNGASLQKQTVQIAKGVNRYEIAGVSKLAFGQYFVQVINDNGQKSSAKVIK